MKILAATPEIQLGDIEKNINIIIEYAQKAQVLGCEAIVFGDCPLTGSSCGDVLYGKTFKERQAEAVSKIANEIKNLDDLTVVFSIFESGARKLIVLKDGVVSEHGGNASIVVKETALNIYTDKSSLEGADTDGINVFIFPFVYTAGFVAEKLSGFRDFSELVIIGACDGESCDDLVYAPLKAYIHNGEVTEYTLKGDLLVFDTEKVQEPLRDITLKSDNGRDARRPFLPADEVQKEIFLFDMLKIQREGLARRLQTIGSKSLVLGLSGGLDSALAFICCVNVCDYLNIPRENIICVTMPGFGTGKRTRGNADKLCELLGVPLKEIDITEAVSLHLHSIDQPKEDDSFKPDVTFENAQARMRTLILMDIANKENGIVVGTGDMSELALGWCTYNGDHMSMYGVNAGIPKTLILPLLKLYAERVARADIRDALTALVGDIGDTPVSPELTPVAEGDIISQVTEETIGPYLLHDFFLYHFIFSDRSEEEVLSMAADSFAGEFSEELIKKTFGIFKRRFVSSQFKRSCMPVGAAPLEYSLSPRTGYRLASDISSKLF